MRSACLYLHYEEAEPEFTLKLPLSASPTVAPTATPLLIRANDLSLICEKIKENIPIIFIKIIFENREFGTKI